MGKGFGELTKARRQVQYGLSPMQQKAFAGAFTTGASNVWRRFTTSFLDWVPGLLLTVGVYEYGNRTYANMHKKNPADFENDE
eukprot:Clim_evm1s181 gene=Clim_evmTU1s181